MTHGAEHIGLIVIFGVVMLPVYVMFAGWFFGKPRDYRTVGITIGYMLAFTVAMVIGLAVLGGVISLVVPA